MSDETKILQQSWNTFTVPNGRHAVRFQVTDDQGQIGWSDPIVVIVTNPQIDIRAQDEDRWKVTRRKTDTGDFNRLEVDKSVTVRINGVMQL